MESGVKAANRLANAEYLAGESLGGGEVDGGGRPGEHGQQGFHGHLAARQQERVHAPGVVLAGEVHARHRERPARCEPER